MLRCQKNNKERDYGPRDQEKQQTRKRSGIVTERGMMVVCSLLRSDMKVVLERERKRKTWREEEKQTRFT